MIWIKSLSKWINKRLYPNHLTKFTKTICYPLKWWITLRWHPVSLSGTSVTLKLPSGCKKPFVFSAQRPREEWNPQALNVNRTGENSGPIHARAFSTGWHYQPTFFVAQEIKSDIPAVKFSARHSWPRTWPLNLFSSDSSLETWKTLPIKSYPVS